MIFQSKCCLRAVHVFKLKHVSSWRVGVSARWRTRGKSKIESSATKIYFGISYFFARGGLRHIISLRTHCFSFSQSIHEHNHSTWSLTWRFSLLPCLTCLKYHWYRVWRSCVYLSFASTWVDEFRLLKRPGC